MVYFITPNYPKPIVAKKKQDRRRISEEKHEIAYVRHVAQVVLRNIKRPRLRYSSRTQQETRDGRPSRVVIIRLCKAVLKFLK